MRPSLPCDQLKMRASNRAGVEPAFLTATSALLFCAASSTWTGETVTWAAAALPAHAATTMPAARRIDTLERDLHRDGVGVRTDVQAVLRGGDVAVHGGLGGGRAVAREERVGSAGAIAPHGGRRAVRVEVVVERIGAMRHRAVGDVPAAAAVGR